MKRTSYHFELRHQSGCAQPLQSNQANTCYESCHPWPGSAVESVDPGRSFQVLASVSFLIVYVGALALLIFLPSNRTLYAIEDDTFGLGKSADEFSHVAELTFQQHCAYVHHWLLPGIR